MLHYNIKQANLKNLGYEFSNHNYISYRKKFGKWHDGLNHLTLWCLAKGKRIEINDWGDASSLLLNYITERYNQKDFDKNSTISFYYHGRDLEIVSYKQAYEEYVPILDEFVKLVDDPLSTTEQKVDCLSSYQYTHNEWWRLCVIKIKHYNELISELEQLAYYVN